MSEKSVVIDNIEECYCVNELAKQSDGSAFLRVGKTAILATAVRGKEPIDSDFLPLTVQYIEKTYAYGKFPGGYFKREGKPSTFEVLTSRIIDRSLRPLFPKGYNYPIQVTIFVFSCDPEVDLQVYALKAAAMAMYISGIPIDCSVSAIRITNIDGNLIINPTNSQLSRGSLDMYVSGSKHDLIMIEMGARTTMTKTKENGSFEQEINELDEDELIDILSTAKASIEEANKIYENEFKSLRKDIQTFTIKENLFNNDISNFLKNNYKDNILKIIENMSKSENFDELKKLSDQIIKSDIAIENEWQINDVINSLELYKSDLVRKEILENHIRADKRGLEDVRKIDIKTNLLPSVHGSCLFTRGATQGLISVTIGTEQDMQLHDNLTQRQPSVEKFMLHYNFPGFSVGEASAIRHPSRRELGHGNLAKKAIEPTINIDQQNAIRVVSEILESNGSSSMLTVCGGSLALKAAGIKTKKLVAGIAMGLVYENEDMYAILTDILGMEDHDGDMDFKVSGTRDGITALQMDIKTKSVGINILKKIILQAKKAREHILDIMEKANDDIVVNTNILPSCENFNIKQDNIPDIIGKGGATIKKIIDTFKVSIDIDKDKNRVKIFGNSKKDVGMTKEFIKDIILNKHKNSSFNRGIPPKAVIGKKYGGKIKNIVNFGMFIELEGLDIDGLLHISKIPKDKSLNISKYYKEGDFIEVIVDSQQKHKISLSL